MNEAQRQFLDRAAAEAEKAQHPFPRMAACEAALESSWGNSELAREANNLFGMKQHRHPVYLTMNLPTREFLNGQWKQIAGVDWVKYPDWSACFADRLATLNRLASVYPHYAAALRAQDPETFVTQVSQTWSTDPGRAQKVIAIFHEFGDGTAAAAAGVTT
jgi:flagellum-specific peptidoglycan hydrolase FlgJ